MRKYAGEVGFTEWIHKTDVRALECTAVIWVAMALLPDPVSIVDETHSADGRILIPNP